MQQDELRSLLTAITADRVALIQRHEAGARAVSHYDFNNAYQYVIAREETQLSWLRSALEEMSAPMPAAATEIPVPPVSKPGKNGGAVRVPRHSRRRRPPSRGVRRTLAAARSHCHARQASDDARRRAG